MCSMDSIMRSVAMYALWTILIGFLVVTGTESIFCGRKAKPGDFPHIVTLVTHDTSYCGGAVLSPSHVLTAAHCVEYWTEEDLTVVAGVVEWNAAEAQKKPVSKIHLHPDYYTGIDNPSFLKKCFLWMLKPLIGDPEAVIYPDNDIAILKLAESFTFNENVKPVTLPQPGYLPYHALVRFAGWGSTALKRDPGGTLFWIRMVILDDDYCVKRDGIWKRETEFCAMDIDGPSCAVWGDSGSPLIVNGVIVGVASTSSCKSGEPTVFIEVSNYLDFIEKTLRM